MGRGSAEWMVVGVLVAVHCCSLLASSATLTVGDTSGWTIGPNYTTWAAAQSFATGDVLFFAYLKGAHNVVEVDKTSYDACSAANAIATYTDGNTNVTLSSTGAHYFLCSFPSHCTSGMHLAVTVGAGTTPAPAPSTSVGTPAPTPTATVPAPTPNTTVPVPAPAPAPTPNTTAPASAPTPTPTPTPSPSPSSTPTPAPTPLSPSPLSSPPAPPPSPASPPSTTGTPPPSPASLPSFAAPSLPSFASLSAVLLCLSSVFLAL